MSHLEPHDLYDLCDTGKRPADKAWRAWLAILIASLVLVDLMGRAGVPIVLALGIGLALVSRYRSLSGAVCPGLAAWGHTFVDGGSLADYGAGERPQPRVSRRLVLDGGSLEHHAFDSHHSEPSSGLPLPTDQTDPRHPWPNVPAQRRRWRPGAA